MNFSFPIHFKSHLGLFGIFFLFFLFSGMICWASAIEGPQTGDIVCAPWHGQCVQYRCAKITGFYITIPVTDPGRRCYSAIQFQNNFCGGKWLESGHYGTLTYPVPNGSTTCYELNYWTQVNVPDQEPTWPPPPTCPEKADRWISNNCNGNPGSYDCATDIGKCDPSPCDSVLDADQDGFGQCQDCDDDNASRAEGCLEDKQQGCQ